MTVSIAQQLLGFYQDQALVRACVVSTSRRAPSNLKDSLGTPRGLHEIADRIGAGAPPGTVFRGCVNIGKHYHELDEEENARNLVVTRILRLRGLEPGVNAGGNVDSYERYIYIQGTNHEDRLGTPVTSGCVHMNNLELIALFDEVRTGDRVWIEN
jgi:hypothetical protein